MRRTPADSFAVLMRRSLYPGRFAGPFSRYGVERRLASGILGNERTGTTHGSPYWYDRHVPMIFMGPGIRAGRVDNRVSTVDFAPTLASYVRVKYPNDLDGKPLPLREEGLRGRGRSYEVRATSGKWEAGSGKRGGPVRNSVCEAIL
jgi:arylsulfatase A-like enzyme